MTNSCATTRSAFRARASLFALCILLSARARAGLLYGPIVSVRHGVYHVAAALLVRAPMPRVFAALTDYGHIGRLNREVRSSAILGFPRRGVTRVGMVVRSCVLFFCFHVRQTEDVRTTADRSIYARIVPRLSNLRYGYARWRLTPFAHGTLVQFHSAVQPDFFIPPLIGPFLLRLKLHHEIRVTLRGLIAVAQNRYTASDRSGEKTRSPRTIRPSPR